MRLGIAAALLLLLFTGATITALSFRVSSLRLDLDQLTLPIEALQTNGMQEPLVAEWVDAEGITHRVSTPKREGQTNAEWVAEHSEIVRLLKEQFPPASR